MQPTLPPPEAWQPPVPDSPAAVHAWIHAAHARGCSVYHVLPDGARQRVSAARWERGALVVHVRSGWVGVEPGRLEEA